MDNHSKRSPLLVITPDLTSDTKRLSIEGEDANHGLNARRLQVGDPIELTNGAGLLASAEITDVNKRGRRFEVAIDTITAMPKLATELVLASALPKGDRLATMLDMATQLGMSRFIPLDCTFSVVKTADKQRDRWQRIVESACRQSRRYWTPMIDAPLTPQSLANSLTSDDILLIGEPGAASVAVIGPANRIVTAIGPEGGFSGEELRLLRAAPASVELSVSPHILRTEAAAIAMLAAANLIG